MKTRAKLGVISAALTAQRWELTLLKGENGGFFSYLQYGYAFYFNKVIIIQVGRRVKATAEGSGDNDAATFAAHSGSRNGS